MISPEQLAILYMEYVGESAKAIAEISRQAINPDDPEKLYAAISAATNKGDILKELLENWI